MQRKDSINREWHEKNRMPRNATIEQRIEWHLDHAKHCACRPIPAKLAQEIERGRASRWPCEGEKQVGDVLKSAVVVA